MSNSLDCSEGSNLSKKRKWEQAVSGTDRSPASFEGFKRDGLPLRWNSILDLDDDLEVTFTDIGMVVDGFKGIHNDAERNPNPDCAPYLTQATSSGTLSGGSNSGN